MERASRAIHCSAGRCNQKSGCKRELTSVLPESWPTLDKLPHGCYSYWPTRKDALGHLSNSFTMTHKVHFMTGPSTYTHTHTYILKLNCTGHSLPLPSVIHSGTSSSPFSVPLLSLLFPSLPSLPLSSPLLILLNILVPAESMASQLTSESQWAVCRQDVGVTKEHLHQSHKDAC